LKNIPTLTPLTINAKPFKIKKEPQRSVWKLKKAFISQGFLKNFSGRTGLTIPVVDASTEPEEIEPVLAQNRKGEQDDKIAPPWLDLDALSHKINVNI
jgi:hypothetical protein